MSERRQRAEREPIRPEPWCGLCGERIVDVWRVEIHGGSYHQRCARQLEP